MMQQPKSSLSGMNSVTNAKNPRIFLDFLRNLSYPYLRRTDVNGGYVRLTQLIVNDKKREYAFLERNSLSSGSTFGSHFYDDVY